MVDWALGLGLAGREPGLVMLWLVLLPPNFETSVALRESLSMLVSLRSEGPEDSRVSEAQAEPGLLRSALTGRARVLLPGLSDMELCR